MSKSVSDRVFSDYLKHGVPWKRLLPLLVGVLLLIIASVIGARSDGAEKEPTEAERLSELCSAITGAEECEVVISYDGPESEGRVRSVAVIVRSDIGIREEAQIKRVIALACGIGTNRVEVVRRAE